MEPWSPKRLPNRRWVSRGTGVRSSTLPGVRQNATRSPRALTTKCRLKPKNHPGAGTQGSLQLHAQGHQDGRQQGDEALGADQGGALAAPVHLDLVGVQRCDRAVLRLVKG